jgi:phage portal protein BeeE
MEAYMSETTALQRFLSLPDWLKRSNGNGMKGMIHSGNGAQGMTWLFNSGTEQLQAGSKVNYADQVGDGLGSSVLAGPLNFLMRTFLEAPPLVERRKKAGEWEAEDDHALTDLLDNPNPFYSGEALWMATVLDFAFGNAYLYKVRNSSDEVIQLWWIPRQLMQPRWKPDGKVFIDHYDYRPGGKTVEIPIKDIVHLRFGIDPRNPRLGLSQLGALMRDIAVDDTAANFIAAVHRNLGIVGVIISPKEKGTPVTKEALKETKEYLKASFTGEKRAEPLALGAPTDVQLLQYNLQGFDVSPVRDVSEERVCAALGLPAAIVGFGTGMQQTRVGATMKELRQLAWTGGIIPIQRIIAKEVMRSLLPEFEESKRQKARFTFDVSKVRALWEDNNEKHARVREDFKAKLIDRATALREVGRSVATEDEGVYFSGPQPIELTNPTNPSKPPSPPPASGDPP